MAEDKKTEEQAEIKISRVVTKVAHFCKSDDIRPSFEGEITGVGIQWPVAFGRYYMSFRMSYCPWCGLHLPNEFKE